MYFTVSFCNKMLCYAIWWWYASSFDVDVQEMLWLTCPGNTMLDMSRLSFFSSDVVVSNWAAMLARVSAVVTWQHGDSNQHDIQENKYYVKFSSFVKSVFKKRWIVWNICDCRQLSSFRRKINRISKNERVFSDLFLSIALLEMREMRSWIGKH